MSKTNTEGGALTVQANGPFLKQLRDELKLYQAQVETNAGINPNRLCQYEKSGRISITDLEKLARFYKESPHRLAKPESLLVLRGLTNSLAALFNWKLVDETEAQPQI